MGGGKIEGGEWIDMDFVCDCGGQYVPVDMDGELIVFRCNKCHRGPQLECPICHKPRTIWSEYKKKCGFCGGYYTNLSEALKEIIGATIMDRVNKLISRMIKAQVSQPNTKIKKACKMRAFYFMIKPFPRINKFD